jgi:hypothetical protein
MKKLITPLFIVLLSAIAPACSQGSQESWARQIFGPSSETLKDACKLAFENPANAVIGELRFKLASRQTLYFRSVTWNHYGMCQSYTPDPRGRDVFMGSEDYTFISSAKYTRASVFVGGGVMESDKINVSLSLESANGKEILAVKSASPSNSGGAYDFGLVPPEKRALLDKVSSFTIIVNSKGKIEKFRLDPSNYSAFLKTQGS